MASRAEGLAFADLGARTPKQVSLTDKLWKDSYAGRSYWAGSVLQPSRYLRERMFRREWTAVSVQRGCWCPTSWHGRWCDCCKQMWSGFSCYEFILTPGNLFEKASGPDKCHQLHVERRNICCPELFIDEWALKKKDEFKTGVKNLKNVHVDDHKIDHAIEENTWEIF